MKTCKHCGESKPLDQFYNTKGGKDGKNAYCIPCHKARSTANYLANRAAYSAGNRKNRLLAEYGMTEAEYDALLEAQGGTCDICNGPPTHGSPNFDVDHDHLTGKVRGLLCRGCDTGLGKFRDDPALMRRAANYIEEHT